MSIILSKYTVKLVKESSAKYDLERKIGSPEDAFNIAKQFLSEESEEVLLMLSLNTKNLVTGVFEVSRGSLSSSIVHPREVFKRAIANNAASIIIAHNHPSGDPTPSVDDIATTKRLSECGKLLGIDLLDHVIVGDTSISLKSRGVI